MPLFEYMRLSSSLKRKTFGYEHDDEKKRRFRPKSQPHSRIVRAILTCVCIAVLWFTLHQLGRWIGFRVRRTVYLRTEDGEELRPAKVAFATMLTGVSSHDTDAIDQDAFFMSTRTLCYQLLHGNETRNSLGAPCLVLVTSTVREDRIKQLRKDGATVIPVPEIRTAWAQSHIKTWDEMETMSKLHLFTLVEYDLIAFIENDVVLTAPLDSIFDDSSVVIRKSRKNSAQDIEDAEEMPDHYLFAGFSEAHRLPSDNDFAISSGLFIMRPSLEMFEYHMSVLEIPDSFDAKWMEQGLWNYIYRQEGNMPWSRLHSGWKFYYNHNTDVQQYYETTA